MDIKVKYFNPKCKLEINPKGDWIDLRSAAHFKYEQGEVFKIPLGVAIQLPSGYEAHIVPRSSTFDKFGLIQLNHMGVVDESYCGDNDQWRMSVLAMKDGEIHEGDRICQFRIIEKMPPLTIQEVERLGNPDRGGFGSTGVK